jgi:hypothetical protein
MGEEGINYRMGNNVYTFRSHYDPSIMVSLAASGMSFVIDTLTIQTGSFPFAVCVRTELDWLVEAGILAMDRIVIEKVELAYAALHYPSGVNILHVHGPVYWTRQDTLIPSSTWIDEDGMYVEIDCAGPDPAEIDLPPQPLVVAVHSINDTRHLRREQEVSSVAVLNSTNRIFNISGRLIHRKSARPQAAHSGIVLIRNSESGMVKRAVTLP